MRRALIITPIFAPERNGVATTVHQLIRSLRRHNWLVEIVAPQYSLDDTTEDSDCRVHRVHGRPIHGYAAGRHFRLFWRLSSTLIDNLKPDVILVFEPMRCRYSTVGPFLPRNTSVPRIGFICTDYKITGRHYRQGILLKLPGILRWLFRDLSAYDLLVTPSLLQRDRLESDGLKNAEAWPLFGVDTSLFRPAQRKRPDTTAVVGCLGRIAPEKAIDAVISACKLLRAKNVSIRLLLIGGHVGKAPPKESDCPWISHTGFVDQRMVAHCLQDCHLLVAANPGETFGLGILEAVATELPVVCPRNLAENIGLVHGKSVRCLDNVSPACVAREVELILNDYESARTMAAEAVKVISGTTWESNLAKVVERLDALVERTTPCR